MPIPSFTDPVPDNGYRWWYIDAVSDNDQYAITVIVFIGSVFSPYYARARKLGDTPAAAHCAINVALYGKPWRWCMTERSQASVRSSAQQLSIGKSCMRVESGKLRIFIDELAMPIPSRVKGELTVDLPAYDLQAHPLDNARSQDCTSKNKADNEPLHFWQPIAPKTRISVSFNQPQLHWQGDAYVDGNYGQVPLEQSFTSWVWSRSHAPDNTTTILYDVIDRQGQSSKRSMCYTIEGTETLCEAPQLHELARTRYWRIPRSARTATGASIGKLQTLEDTPFYSRSRFVERHPHGEQVTVHESLYLDRFESTWVRSLLPFRMPRSTRPVLPDSGNI